MFDLIIRGGDVVTPQGVIRGDVAVAGETIAAIAAAGALSTETAKRVIDATGQVVMPGGIDPHVHHASSFVDQPDGTPLITQGPDRVGHGGAAGRHHHADRFRLLARRTAACRRIETRDKEFVGEEPVRLGLPPHAARSEPPHTQFGPSSAEAIQAGYPTHQDLHHQHLALSHAAA